MMPDKKELLIKIRELKRTVKVFNGNINRIIKMMNIVKDNINNFYKLEEYLINNYEPKNEIMKYYLI